MVQRLEGNVDRALMLQAEELLRTLAKRWEERPSDGAIAEATSKLQTSINAAYRRLVEAERKS